MRKQARLQYVALLATIALLAVSRIAPVAADNILFYNHTTGVAAVGAVSPNGAFRDLKTHAFDRDWQIVCASNGVVLFYNPYTGLSVTVRFAADGSYSELKTFNLDKRWGAIVPLSGGKLLFYNHLTGAAATGILSTDGSFRDLGVNLGFGPYVTLRESRNGTLLWYKIQFESQPGGIPIRFGSATTARIASDGNYINGRLDPQRWPDVEQITPIFGEGFLLRGLSSGKTHLAMLNTATNTARINPVAGMQDFVFIVAMNNDMLLCYNPYTGMMATGNLVPATPVSLQFVPLQSQRLDLNWSYVIVLR